MAVIIWNIRHFSTLINSLSTLEVSSYTWLRRPRNDWDSFNYIVHGHGAGIQVTDLGVIFLWISASTYCVFPGSELLYLGEMIWASRIFRK